MLTLANLTLTNREQGVAATAATGLHGLFPSFSFSWGGRVWRPIALVAGGGSLRPKEIAKRPRPCRSAPLTPGNRGIPRSRVPEVLGTKHRPTAHAAIRAVVRGRRRYGHTAEIGPTGSSTGSSHGRNRARAPRRLARVATAPEFAPFVAASAGGARAARDRGAPGGAA